jgi:hypothetical protein
MKTVLVSLRKSISIRLCRNFLQRMRREKENNCRNRRRKGWRMSS